MVTVVKRPQGHKIIDQAVASTIIDSSGDALISQPYHALSTGAVVYIDSDIDEYNGFWYVTSTDSNSFKISEYEGADFVEFYQEIDIDYYQTQEHDWSSIYLPIIYKATNNKWPTNSVNAASLIVLNSDDNGFTELTLAGPVAGLNAALEFVTISGASTESANGVWQVVEIVLSNVIVINLPYESSGNLTGASIQTYYNNYQVKVKIFAGLPAAHPWEDKKPYTEVAELSLTPDDNNEVMFSVAEYIRMKVAIKNNTTIFSYPLNLDAFTGFYISTGETYDQSDNYSLYTTDTVFFPDEFEGYAIAGKLPFKNMYSGDYADYVYTSGSPANWLTLMERPIAVENYFFDISFIKNIAGTFNLIIDKYVSDYLTQTEVIPYPDYGMGVYRMPIVANALYDSFCIRVRTDAHDEEVPPEEVDLSEMVNSEAAGAEWTLGEFPSVVLPGAISSTLLVLPKTTLNGQTLKVNYSFAVDAGVSPSVGVYFNLTSDTSSLEDYEIVLTTSNGVVSGSVNVLATADRDYFTILASNGGTTPTVTILSISFGDPSTITVPGVTATEEICIDIMESCDVENEVVQDADRRLLEDGDFRLLE